MNFLKSPLLSLLFLVSFSGATLYQEGSTLVPLEPSHNPDGNVVRHYKKMGIDHLKKKNFPKADTAFQMCIDAAVQTQNRPSLGQCLNNRGYAVLKLKQYDKAILCYTQATELYYSLGMKTRWAQSSIDLGLSYKKAGINDSAIVNYYRGITFLESQNDSSEVLMRAYNKLGSLYRLEDNLGGASAYFHKSMTMALHRRDSAMMSRLHNNLGNTFRDRKKYDSALFHFSQSLKLKESNITPGPKAISHLNMGHALMDKGKYPNALKHLHLSYDFRLQAGDSIGLVRNLIALAAAQQQSDNLPEARCYLEEAEQLSDLLQLPLGLKMEFLMVKMDLLKEQGMLRQALGAAEQLIMYNDSAQSVIQQKFIVEYRTRFEVQRLLQSLQVAELELTRQELSSAKAQLRFVILAFCALAVIAVLIYYAHGKKKKVKIKQAEALENELRYEDIRHRSKNNHQLLSSVIELKRGQIEDRRTQSVLGEIEQQCEAINLTMQFLHFSREDKKGQLDFAAYLRRMVQHLAHVAGLSSENLCLSEQLSTVFLSDEQAGPLSLIANEILTNSIKYGKSSSGVLHLDLRLQQKEGMVTLALKDSGRGFPKPSLRSEGTGTGLVQLLTRQLRGTARYEEKNGLCFNICFKKR